MKDHQLINQDSGITEYYTPPHIVEAARLTMGGIDLDPASSARANEIVKAGCYFGIEDDGLDCTWFGNVWLNHPFSRVGNPLWINKLVDQYQTGYIVTACCITYASTSEQWFQPLYAYPMCFLSPRTNYLLPNGKVKRGVTKGSVVTYMGNDLDAFRRHFCELGSVKV
jgi:hypothetical protein